LLTLDFHAQEKKAVELVSVMGGLLIQEQDTVVGPAPIPTVWLSLAKTIAFDFTCLTAFQAKFNASLSAELVQ
jgi:hypothetical protein